jgi:hypothetical protein
MTLVSSSSAPPLTLPILLCTTICSYICDCMA